MRPSEILGSYSALLSYGKNAFHPVGHLLREWPNSWKVAFTEEGKQTVRDLDERLTWLFAAGLILRDDDNQRLLNGISLQMERGRNPDLSLRIQSLTYQQSR